MSGRIAVRAFLSAALLAGALYAARPAAARAASGAHRPPPAEVLSQAITGDTPTLRCTAQPWSVQDPSVSLVAVTCRVTGAAPEEDAFRLSATLASPSGDARTLDPFCIVPLNDGQGECGRQLTQPVEAAGGRLTITGTIRPSGRVLSASAVALPDRPG
jgi:hypothetical protein